MWPACTSANRRRQDRRRGWVAPGTHRVSVAAGNYNMGLVRRWRQRGTRVASGSPVTRIAGSGVSVAPITGTVASVTLSFNGNAGGVIDGDDLAPYSNRFGLVI
jgi:hypothetical protein